MAKTYAKWQSVVTISWPFEIGATLAEMNGLIKTQFQEMIGKHIPQETLDKIKISTKAYPHAVRVSHAARLSGPYNPDDILQFRVKDRRDIPAEEEFRKFTSDNGEWIVSMISQRYHLFARDNCVCQACGLKGTVMYLERARGSKEGKAHFNLYGIENGEEVLFTKDHKLASALGGGDSLNNLQTYCDICNHLKGHHNATNEQVKELREVYNKNKNNKSLLAVSIREKKVGIGNQANFGKRKRKHVGVKKAYDLALNPYLEAAKTLMVVKSKSNHYWEAFEWAALRNKTKTNMEVNGGVVIPAGTKLQVGNVKGGNVMCFYHITEEEPMKIRIPGPLLREVQEEVIG
jgi:hypothetical protein